jgi:aldehyde:ferredoxin oxidoreductase
LYGSFGLTNRAKLLNYITGWDVTAQELGKIGERVNCLQHLFNIRMGMVPEQENVMPLRFTKPHKGGGAAGKVPDWQGIIKEYWKTKGWDPHGIPLTDKVKELGLEDAVV